MTAKELEDKEQITNENAGIQTDAINDFGSTVSGEPAIHCLTIVGQIEGHQVLPDNVKTTKYEHIMPLIAAIEESEEIRRCWCFLNTAAAMWRGGLGIAELIAGMTKPTAQSSGRPDIPIGRAPCRGGKEKLHCAVGCHDNPSRAPERTCNRRAPAV